MEDERFLHVANDPKFRRIPKGERKVKIDKRFQSMFEDKKFKVKYTTDKRGRPVNHSTTEDLMRYYELSSDEDTADTGSFGESDDEELVGKENDSDSSIELEDKQTKSEKILKPNKVKSKAELDERIPKQIKKKLTNLNVDYARGESNLYSESSSDDDETEEEASETDEIDHKWGELDVDAERTEGATNRLAACNLDWDRIRAVDLMVLFNSFLPPGGVVKSVVIYPSEYGKKRMLEEDIKGPIELVESKLEDNDSGDGNNDNNEDGSNYHMEKLRQYQLNRLKYFYAVVTFDSANSANKIYSECDGMEYESSSTKIDLRFIPDDMEFDDEPKETCDKLPEVDRYQPRFFTTTALQQAKVDLTWDETDPTRLEIAEKLNTGKVDDISEVDLQNYLASSSGEESDDESRNESDDELISNSGNSIDKYKALLLGVEEKEKSKKEKDVQMEISWGIDLKEKTEKLVKERMAGKEEKTPFEKYLDKKKEKKKEKRKEKRSKKDRNDEEANDGSDSDVPSDIDMNDPYFAEEFDNDEFKKPSKKSKGKSKKDGEEKEENQDELELLLMNEEESNSKHFSLKKIQDQENDSKAKKKKKNKKKQDKDDQVENNFEIDVEDDRFSALFNSHHYNIDPTDSHYKKTKAMETLIKEKLKRRTEDNNQESVKKIKVENKRNPELSLLVKSVKRKTDAYKNK